MGISCEGINLTSNARELPPYSGIDMSDSKLVIQVNHELGM